MKIKHKYIYRDFFKKRKKERNISPLANCADIYGSPSFLDPTLDSKMHEYFKWPTFLLKKKKEN